MSTTCSGCGHENREDLRFCTQCGAPLAAVCPACGAPAELGGRFCGHCGTSFNPSATRAPSPEAVAVPGEKKQITVLFADVAGSMDLQERLDAEVWAQIMGRFVSILAEGVRRFGGTVDKFTGDGIMALFGAPVAQEDHARRACHAAWHLTKAIAAYSAELRRDEGVELQVRLGLNSGEVVVGRVGDDMTLDPTALGHTVGLAQRMEAMAEPGTAYLTEYTARLVEGWFRLQGLGGRSVKGVGAPLQVFALGSPVASSLRRTVGASRLVGRGEELAVLDVAVNMACEGQFQVVGVVGEAGVGKSRLCDEFARSVGERGITVRRAVGVSHGKEVPLLPMLAFQREYFGIGDGDDAPAARQKVTDRLLELDPGLEDTLPLLFDFLEVPDPDRPVPAMAPEVRMRRLFDAVRRITVRRSERETLVLVFEDLHWFDPQSEAFLERLIESYPGSRTLVVTNFRPEFSARWMRHSYYRQLPLSPLPEHAIGELLGGLLGVDLSMAPLVSFVLERTGGNPFFVEEVVRGLIEDGTLAGSRGNYRLTRSLHEIRVPPSVQAVLAARIDRLSVKQKAVLETASVIGRTFDRVVLSRVTAIPADELDDALSALCGAELLQETGDDPSREYRFWHPLTQEVAYESLLGQRRRRLHAAVAEALTNMETDRLDEIAAVVAWHWERAARPFEAADWSLRAGNWAVRSDLSEAVRRWQAATGLLEPVAQTPESLQLGIQIRIRLLRFGARRGMTAEEAARLETEGRDLAHRLGDPRLAVMMAVACGTARCMSGDLSGGRALYREAIERSRETDDADLKATCFCAASGAYPYAGPLTEGVELTTEVLNLLAENPGVGSALIGFDLLGLTLALRGWLLSRSGNLAEAVHTVERAVAVARSRSESPEALGFALALSPWLSWLTGEPDDSLTRAAEAVRLAEETNNSFLLACALRGQALATMAAARPVEAIAACDRALTECRAARGGLQFEGEHLNQLACARLAVGDLAGAERAAAEAVAVARRQGAEVVECHALLIRAQTLRAAGAAEVVVRADLNSALDLVRETGAHSYAPFIREELARLDDDEKEMEEALRLYSQIGATGHARRLEAELSSRTVR